MSRLGASDVRLRATSKAAAMQRAGRCGRTQPGVCLRLYTIRDFEWLRDESAPEIHNIDVSFVVLKALAFGFMAVDLPFMDQPPTESLLYAHEHLLDL